MDKALWGSVAGTTYRGANEEFGNSQVVMYYSGSWQISQFATQIKDTFDWWAVPNPCGDVTCTGMPGGSGLVAVKYTQHPKEVARVIEWLAAEDNLREFYERSLFIPAHAGILKTGLKFRSDDPRVVHALDTFSAEATKLVAGRDPAQRLSMVAGHLRRRDQPARPGGRGRAHPRRRPAKDHAGHRQPAGRAGPLSGRSDPAPLDPEPSNASRGGLPLAPGRPSRDRAALRLDSGPRGHRRHGGRLSRAQPSRVRHLHPAADRDQRLVLADRRRRLVPVRAQLRRPRSISHAARLRQLCRPLDLLPRTASCAASTTPPSSWWCRWHSWSWRRWRPRWCSIAT